MSQQQVPCHACLAALVSATHATGAPAVAHIKQNDCGPAHGKAIIGLPDTPAIPSVDDSINLCIDLICGLLGTT